MDKGVTDEKRLVFISRSDLRGGAAIVTFRLVEALRALGVDAQMLVCEKLSDAPFVHICASKLKIRGEWLRERLRVYMQNGHSRPNLFKIDPALYGLPLWRHPLLKQADAVFLGWVNQGMLSLEGVRKICALGKPVIWVMHDMWNMTGICHHAGNCTGYLKKCGDCPLLGIRAYDDDMSRRTWESKQRTYRMPNIRFVAVSFWLAAKAAESSLMRNADVTVIPNPFNIGIEKFSSDDSRFADGKVRIIFGGASIDDPIKGLPVLKKALKIIADRHPEIAARMEIVTFGQFKDSENADGFHIAHTHLGVLRGLPALREAYSRCGIVVSTSDYETLPGTLVEGQAFGCIPVATDHGGQPDIIRHLFTGWLAPWNDSPSIRAEEIACGLLWAFGICTGPHYNDMRQAMFESVAASFSAPEVARRILALLRRQPSE